MTRKEFMASMFESIFERKCMEYISTNQKTVEYKIDGTFLRDCTYSSYYKGRTLKTITALLDENLEKFKWKDKNLLDVRDYQKRAKKFVVSFINIDIDCRASIVKVLEEQLTLSVLESIYRDIIIEELFNIKPKKASKELGNDDFEESNQKITQRIINYLNSESKNIIPNVKKNLFFEFLIKNNPFFSEIDFDSENPIVKEDFEYAMGIVKNSANPMSCIPDVDIVDFMISMKADNGHFAEFGDIENITEDDFWRLEEVLEQLCVNSQSYYYFQIEDINVFKNTAVRIYNKLYGEKHKKYEGRLERQAWITHSVFAEYLLGLSWAIQYKMSE